MRILIADDEDDFRELLREMLGSWGYEVTAVGDGAAALQVLRGQDPPRLAILDWMMPGVDGLELCRTVRRELPKPYTYLILVTSHRAGEDVVAGMEAGADDYLTKPLDINELRVRLNAGRRIVELQERLLAVQEDLAARASELEAANIDIESFSYTVANHILKSLMAIGDNSKAIRDLYCGEDAQCLAHTRRIYEKTKHLAQLIGTMIEFFRPARGELHRTAVDLSALAAEEVERLRKRDPQRQLAVRIAEGVVANGDREMLAMVLHHLLDNAWKQTAQSAEPMIEFGAKEVAGEMVYFVRDSGPGFDMAETENLFNPFRGVPGSDLPAMGVGLATVARTIRRHGGSVWAEGERGKGATFYFTLRN